MKNLLTKLAEAILVLALVSVGVFMLVELVPGDPAVAALGPNATDAEYDAARERMGLDEGLPTRYADWVSGAVKGDFGDSLFAPHRSVSDLVWQRLPVTIELAVLALLISTLIAVPLALWTAYRTGSRADNVTTGLAFGALSLPSFLAGLLLVFFFVFYLGTVKWVFTALAAGWFLQRLWVARSVITQERVRHLATSIGVTALVVAVVWALPEFPRQGFSRLSDGGIGENLRYIALPAFTLALTETAIFVRLLRSDLIETFKEDYISAARAKGMPVTHILLRHALRPSSMSLVTVIGVTLGRLIGGSVVVEIIFNLPGMGRLLIDSITTKDYPVVQAAVLVVAVVYIALNTLVDLLYGFLDPRVRRTGG